VVLILKPGEREEPNVKSLTGSIAATFAIAGCGVSSPGDPTAEQPVEQQASLSSTARANAAAGRYTLVEVPTSVAYGYSRASKLACNTGAVIGGASITSTVGEHAITFDGSTLTDLGTLGGDVSTALGGNARGTVVGVSGTATSGGGSGPGHAFVVRDGVMTDLGGLGGQFSEAWAVNAREQIVGSSTVVPSGGDVPSHAALWDGRTATDLGTLGGTDSWARGINNAGVI